MLFLPLLLSLSLCAATSDRRLLLNTYCTGCHNAKLKSGNLALDTVDTEAIAANTAVWERVVRQLSTGQMPPPNLPRPDAARAKEFVHQLIDSLDRAAAANPNPGVTMPHRLNRLEYSNAIRDLLALDTQPGLQLPVDESGNGFDNMADLLSISPALLERYISAARSISRLVIGDLKLTPAEETYGNGRGQKSAAERDQLPIGAAGGLALRHYFPLDAEYEIRIQLGNNSDGEQKTPYRLRLPVKAGLHSVSATFLAENARAEIALRPTGRRFGPDANPSSEAPAEMDLRIQGVSVKRFQVPRRGGNVTGVGSIVIGGPHNITGRGDTSSRAKIFSCRPAKPTDETPCAQSIVANLAPRAFRRPVDDRDLRPLLRFYQQARERGEDFDNAIGASLQALLVSPDFLFRVERNPKGAQPGSVHRVNDYELASRLSFFLWSTIPDDELLQLAAAGKLKDPAVVRAQLRRMTADSRSDTLITNFGAQWLYLRTLAGVKPDPDVFPAFDEDLRQAFLRETELFLASIFREDRSVLQLLEADYTFANQRLAAFYGIPNVYGTHFRKVALSDRNRGGLLGQGSILTVTSYPNRTSVVQRGKWILDNLLGTPPPPAPADVPEFPVKAKDGRKLSMREAMEVHRSNAVCASCHARMDPIGFALENFDGVGQWRSQDAGDTIDARGKLPNGSEFQGPAGLKKLLLERHREEFVQNVAAKLLMFALGRGLEPYDQPAVRLIAAKAAREDYRMTAFLSAVVESVPFQMRRTSEK
ncbi:MAG: DUF1592 domain-containing protein [Candidatus Solibacter usitatus]|nr:DUF1592 domain-containing protein [Candidatus Solibacter usitatus]